MLLKRYSFIHLLSERSEITSHVDMWGAEITAREKTQRWEQLIYLREGRRQVWEGIFVKMRLRVRTRAGSFVCF